MCGSRAKTGLNRSLARARLGRLHNAVQTNTTLTSIGEAMESTTTIKHTAEEFENVRDAYESGKRIREKYGEDHLEHMDEYLYDYPVCYYDTSTAVGNAFEAGVDDRDMPRYANGWRYGDIPIAYEEGEAPRSYDYRDNEVLDGVSMVEIEGEEPTGDCVSLAFIECEGRPVVHAAGWVSHTRGPDDEPLIIEPRVIEDPKKRNA